MDVPRRRAKLVAAFAALVVVAGLIVFLVHGRTGDSAGATAASGATSGSAAPPAAAAPASSAAPTPSTSSRPASGTRVSAPAVSTASVSTASVSTASVSAPMVSAATVSTPPVSSSAAANAAKARIKKIEAGRRAHSISIAALNMDTGVEYTSGSTGGMRTGSIVKLWILETLFMQKQAAGSSLTSSQRALATRMIENSDNDAAETLYEEIGRQPGMRQYERRLGMRNTTIDPNGYWGLTTTCATDYIALLKNLVVANGPLPTTSRKYILGLMRLVEADQRWGVGVAADHGTDFANKNGWLNVDDDAGLWLVNSTGVLTVHGQLVLMAVQTQHNSDFQIGIALVQKLAKAMVPIIAPAPK